MLSDAKLASMGIFTETINKYSYCKLFKILIIYMITITNNHKIFHILFILFHSAMNWILLDISISTNQSSANSVFVYIIFRIFIISLTLSTTRWEAGAWCRARSSADSETGEVVHFRSGNN